MSADKDRVSADKDLATPRPWTHRPNHKPYHIVIFGGRKAYEAGYTTSDIRAADAALIVEAVNNYDRLRAIEAAARVFMEFDAGPPDLPGDEWEPAARALWNALAAIQGGSET